MDVHSPSSSSPSPVPPARKDGTPTPLLTTSLTFSSHVSRATMLTFKPAVKMKTPWFHSVCSYCDDEFNTQATKRSRSHGFTICIRKKKTDWLNDGGVAATTLPVLVRPTKMTLATRASEESSFFLGAGKKELWARKPDNSKPCATHCENSLTIQTCSHQRVVPVHISHDIPLPTGAAHP